MKNRIKIFWANVKGIINWKIIGKYCPVCHKRVKIGDRHSYFKGKGGNFITVHYPECVKPYQDMSGRIISRRIK